MAILCKLFVLSHCFSYTIGKWITKYLFLRSYNITNIVWELSRNGSVKTKTNFLKNFSLFVKYQPWDKNDYKHV